MLHVSVSASALRPLPLQCGAWHVCNGRAEWNSGLVKSRYTASKLAAVASRLRRLTGPAPVVNRGIQVLLALCRRMRSIRIQLSGVDVSVSLGSLQHSMVLSVQSTVLDAHFGRILASAESAPPLAPLASAQFSFEYLCARIVKDSRAVDSPVPSLLELDRFLATLTDRAQSSPIAASLSASSSLCSIHICEHSLRNIAAERA
jgi:hypothetical protein